MNVLIIPEDFRTDQYILKPIVEAMLKAAGKPRANVVVCTDPLLAGIDQALRWERIAEILEMYPMVQLFLLIVDRDGEESRRIRLDNIEKQAAELLKEGSRLLAENAWQEIEVWALAGQDLPPQWKWGEIRREKHPKERFFNVFARARGLLDEPGQGRRTLGLEAARQYRRVQSRCLEDVVHLERRL